MHLKYPDTCTAPPLRYIHRFPPTDPSSTLSLNRRSFANKATAQYDDRNTLSFQQWPQPCRSKQQTGSKISPENAFVSNPRCGSEISATLPKPPPHSALTTPRQNLATDTVPLSFTLLLAGWLAVYLSIWTASANPTCAFSHEFSHLTSTTTFQHPLRKRFFSAVLTPVVVPLHVGRLGFPRAERLHQSMPTPTLSPFNRVTGCHRGLITITVMI